jgi:predicted homoserine dehydrogenase-like protein
VNFGVIGYGYWGPNVVRNLASLEGSQVRAIAELNPAAQARAMKAYPGIHITADTSEVHDLAGYRCHRRHHSGVDAL